MTSRKGNTITWTSYNYPSEIIDGPRTYDYSCDASRQKWKQVYTSGSTSETTYFAGRIFEKNVNSNDTDYRHYIMANGRAVAMFVERTSLSDYTRYFTHDHLGNTDGVIMENGTTVDVAESFSAYGERRDPNDWVGDPSSGDLGIIGRRTDRGYTDHVSLEKSSLVHMNGRVYDAEIGRFLSPDPFVADPQSTQGFNRYAYVYNSPTRFTDPSGFICTGPDIIICVDVFRTIFNFLSDDDEPTPDWCKDNTRGCGGAPASNLFENISLDFYVLALDDKDDEEEEEIDEIIVYGSRLPRMNPWTIAMLSKWLGGIFTHLFYSPGPVNPDVDIARPSPMNVQCEPVQAQILDGNPANLGQQGGFPAVPVTPGSAAIIPRQFTGAAAAGFILRDAGERISGVTDTGQRFAGLTETVGSAELMNQLGLSNMLQVQDHIVARSNHRLIIELVSGGRHEIANVTITAPSDFVSRFGCPTGAFKPVP